ncbi:MAG: class I SAM-dependent methyltransferase [Rhodospirillales bacterium]|nr:class I SAM-dependent methyltransferase [Rhodospirillales bacterium]
MSRTDRSFDGSIPELYDTYLVPLIFEAYADDMASRVAALQPDAVLETATGTGAVTRALAPLLKEGVRYVATDINQPMLERAARMQSNAKGIEWRQADAMSLPFEDRSFAAVCCQFGAMFFPDRIAGYAETRRVLRPGGQFVFSVWDRIEENEFADLVTQAAALSFPDDPPRFLARTPHGYHHAERITLDVRAAGFKDVGLFTIAERSRAPSARHVAIAYVQGTPLRNEIEARDASRLEDVTETAAGMIAERFGAGPVEGKIQGHVVVAQA